ncbi:hypothetical protein F4802DRAFT_600824 [Xylaria palmicola]|nr:hypothetical protein F4802DRAFT_600824 [Xylaria palmicola]
MSQVMEVEFSKQSRRLETRSTAPSPTTSTWTAGAALLFGALTYALSSKKSEFASELVCWIVLPIFYLAKKYAIYPTPAEGLPLPVNRRSAESGGNEILRAVSLWVVAISIASCSVFRAELGVTTLFPALTPLLVMGHKYLKFTLYPPSTSQMSLLPPLTHSVLGTTLVAIIAVVASSEWEPIPFALSAVPVAALFVTYTLLTPHPIKRSWCLPSCDFEAVVSPLSLRVLAIQAIILGVETYMVGFPSINGVETVILGLCKALTWHFTAEVARTYSWLAATTAGTFSLLATRSPFTQHTDARALMVLVASLISLGQNICLLAKRSRPRWILCLLAFVPVVPYFANRVSIQYAQKYAVHSAGKHPVDILARQAKNTFGELLRNQSDTYPAAHAEYKRRYGFEPPLGFQEWYEFARSHQSPIIDEFDIITEGVAPFLRLSGKEVLETISSVYDQPDHELWSCAMSGQPAKTECSHHERENDRNNAHFFDRIMSQIPAFLDIKFLLNHLDEPTVILPPPSQQANKPKITNLGGRRSWEALTKYCSSQKARVNTAHTTPVETYGLPFITDRKSAMDLCQHPEYSEMHGLLAAPESLRLTEGLVPVLSNGAPSIMGDILYPSSAYVEEDRFAYHAEHDVDWDAKANNLYWAGSTTGGHGFASRWQDLHRQRFVALAQNLGRRPFSYLREQAGAGAVARYATPFLDGRLYDVAFANVLQCDRAACRAQRQHFATRPWASGDRPYLSRLVFDLDGNGISGRFYKLLASRSAPLKQSLIREWHDERLAPWVHYVPVSQGMGELPELVLYLTSTESGRARAREIAEQGQQWFAQAFREVDYVIYMYRLFLELARLQDPNRPAWILP